MVVISPHLDDAVFSCGEAIAGEPGSTVITVFAGVPSDGALSTEWDARCGFATAREAVLARREEDRRALTLLGADPVWLPFCDSQYGETAALHDIAAAIAGSLRDRPGDLVLYPLGLFHSDHLLTHQACLQALSQTRAAAALAYEDALYRAMPGLLQARLAALARESVRATPRPSRLKPGQRDRKDEAVAAYASQLRTFGPDGYADTRQPERCWRLEPAEAET